MLPTPITTSARCLVVSKKAWWMTFRARTCCAVSITKEMFRSDAPCAMALTFTLWRPSEAKIFPDTPGVPFMPSPTTATMV